MDPKILVALAVFAVLVLFMMQPAADAPKTPADTTEAEAEAEVEAKVAAADPVVVPAVVVEEVEITGDPAAQGWGCYSGIDVPLKKNTDGDIQCISINSRDCLWVAGGCDATLKSIPSIGSINPLVCGSMHKSNYGMTGYDDPGHWCYKGRQILK